MIGKKIVTGILTAALILGVCAPNVRAEEMVEKPYLGLDPSTIISEEAESPVLPQIELKGRKNSIVQMDGSKKGIQGTDWMSETDALDLGIKHVLLNLGITPVLIDGDTEYTYNGKTYRFNSRYLEGYKKTVRSMNASGIAVTIVLLVQDDVNLQNWSDLVFAPERGHNFYGLNTDTAMSRDTWGAVFSFLAEQFGQTNCQIEHWILGNEVNVPSAYNWTGTMDVVTNARVYAQSFVLLYNALQAQNNINPLKPKAKAYISLDRAWTAEGDGITIGSKRMLDQFAVQVNKIQQGVDWCVAFHPYAVVMDPTNNHYKENEKKLWGNNPYTTNSLNTKYITAANLNVLTDYVKNTYGQQHRIILSEQGFDAKGGEGYQAASLAYTFYAGQFNDMVDAIIFRAWKDHAEEFGLKLGIYGRESHNVFQYMDTTVYGGETNSCLNEIGIGAWNQLVPGFAMQGMGYRDVFHDSWYLDSVKAVSDAGIMTGLNPTDFGAGLELRRGEFATVLYRMEGSPVFHYTASFPDVENGNYYSIPISWANNQKIATGYENGYFGPNNGITREELATLIYRYAKYQGRDTSSRADLNRYGDAKRVSGFASEAMQWVVSEGIIQGEGSTGLLNPQGQVYRSVAATVIARYKGM